MQHVQLFINYRLGCISRVENLPLAHNSAPFRSNWNNWVASFLIYDSSNIRNRTGLFRIRFLKTRIWSDQHASALSPGADWSNFPLRKSRSECIWSHQNEYVCRPQWSRFLFSHSGFSARIIFHLLDRWMSSTFAGRRSQAVCLCVAKRACIHMHNISL